MRRVSLAVLALTTCTPAPDPAQVAQEFLAGYDGSDETTFDARFTRPHSTRFEWFRERLGACDPPTQLWSRGPRSARFRYACERGAIEASFTLDDRGRLTDLRFGAVGIPAEEPLASTVRAVVATFPWRETDAPAGIDQDVTRPYARALGRCDVDRPWLVSPAGGLFHLRCEWGEAILRIGIDPHGNVRVLNLMPPTRRPHAEADHPQ